MGAAGHGSGTVRWTTTAELDIAGFNVIQFTNKGARVQLNTAIIGCAQCITGIGHDYAFIVPKHKGGRSIFIEMLRRNSPPQTFGPAIRQ